MTFGEKLQKLRTRAGLSQDQLAKLLDVSRINALGWEAYVPLEDGLRDAYNAYLAALEQPRGH